MTGPRSYFVNDLLEKQLWPRLLCMCAPEPCEGSQAENWTGGPNFCREEQWEGRGTPLSTQGTMAMSRARAGKDPSWDLLPQSHQKQEPWQSCPMKGPYNISRDTRETCRAPFHEPPTGSWNSNREISQTLKMNTLWQKMKLQDIEMIETTLWAPHITTHPIMSHL